jgi:hypothetical protein
VHARQELSRIQDSKTYVVTALGILNIWRRAKRVRGAYK